jgi:hypothetical protein
MNIGRILPGIAILSGRIFVCGGEVDSQILANGEVSRTHRLMNSVADPGSGAFQTPGFGMTGSRIRITDEYPRSYFRELKNNFFGLTTIVLSVQKRDL